MTFDLSASVDHFRDLHSGGHRRNRGLIPPARLRGFTLVEMLVAVALVMLLMLMFAQVFQIATEAMGTTRGMAENDQRARSLQMIIKADLDKRTYRWVYPFAASESTSAPSSQIGERKGFFYVSENNPANDLDDVLHLTVMSTNTMRNTDSTPYYGQAMNLPLPIVGVNTTATTVTGQNFGYVNQPDADDAQLNPNSTGLSTVAEVVYFVRNGSLYRRQLLLREQLTLAGESSQPADSSGNRLFDASPTAKAEGQYPSTVPRGTPPTTGSPATQKRWFAAATTFWNDFDYSAALSDPVTGGAKFNGTDSLDNSLGGIGAIAHPANRYGFSPFLTGGPAGYAAGRPREFCSTGFQADRATPLAYSDDLADFIGRFTAQECSDIDFQYPHALTTGGNIPTDPRLILSMTNHVITGPDNFSDGTSALDTTISGGGRRGEDLLLSNVHAFDVQLWDDFLGRFVNLCDVSLSANADYSRLNRDTPAYGPREFTGVMGSGGTNPETASAVNAVYDTWHPLVGTAPPIRPLKLKATSVTDPNPTANFTTWTDQWKPAQVYAVGDIVFPTGPPGSTYGAPYPANTLRKLPFGQPFFYRCTEIGTTPLSASSTNATYPVGPVAPAGPTDYLLEPNWPLEDGMTVVDNPTDNSGDNRVVWQAVDNRKRLKAIRIQIRFMDTSTQQMRNLTIVHSLVD